VAEEQKLTLFAAQTFDPRLSSSPQLSPKQNASPPGAAAGCDRLILLFKNQQIAAYGRAYKNRDFADVSDRFCRLSVGSAVARIWVSLTHQRPGLENPISTTKAHGILRRFLARNVMAAVRGRPLGLPVLVS